jgi:lauroyl/myristoyl acyltransferase
MFHAQFNVRPIIGGLRDNSAVMLMGDGLHSASFVEVEFLGRSVPFTTGPISIARATQASIVPFFVTGTPPENLKIVIEQPIQLEKSDDAQRDLEAMVGKYAHRLEHHLCQNIPCWENWLYANTLDKMINQLEKPLSERYEI